MIEENELKNYWVIQILTDIVNHSAKNTLRSSKISKLQILKLNYNSKRSIKLLPSFNVCWATCRTNSFILLWNF